MLTLHTSQMGNLISWNKPFLTELTGYSSETVVINVNINH